MEEDKPRTIASVKKELAKKYPGLTLLKGSEVEVECDATGIKELDDIIRGFRVGGYSVLWGPDGSAKTALALHTIATAQVLGKRCAFLDAEHRFDPLWANSLGVDTDALLTLQLAESLEDSLMGVETLVKGNMIDMLVIDSVTSLVAEQELSLIHI